MTLNTRNSFVAALTASDYACCETSVNTFDFGAYYFTGFSWHYYFAKHNRNKGR